jgi:hypothetical protein
MERPEAEALRAELAAGHPDRATHSFILCERDGDWSVAKVAVPPGAAGVAPGMAGGPQPVHDHGPGDLPGGLPPHSAGF